MKTIKQCFPENLRQLRIEHELTREELAQTIGVHPQTIGFWERGTRLPQYHHFAPLAKALRISETDLFFDPSIVSKEKALRVLADQENFSIVSIDPLGVAESLKTHIKKLSRQAYKDLYHIVTQFEPTSDDWSYIREHLFLRRRGRRFRQRNTKNRTPPSST